jgi:hypothetical protein
MGGAQMEAEEITFVEDRIVLELKAVQSLTKAHEIRRFIL